MLLAGLSYAYVLPPGLQAAADQTVADARNISLAIAFFGGVLGILSPCLLPLLPAFFAYTFREKKFIAKFTFAFFLGFSLVFVLMGLSVSFLGSLLIENRENFAMLAGVLMVIFGLMALSGRGFSGLKLAPKASESVSGVFLMGVVFALGWTPCIGPILAGILVLASLSSSPALLLFAYSLGLFLPLFVLSVLYDRYGISKRLSGKELVIFGFRVHSTNLVSGLLLILLGSFMFVSRGTSPINATDPIGTKDYFYSLQRALAASGLSDAVILIALMPLAYLAWARWGKAISSGWKTWLSEG